MVKHPVISVNKLGEYIVCRAARQRALLRQRKYPDPDFKLGTFHREAMDAIQQYLASGAIDPRTIENTLNSLNQRAPTKIGSIRRIDSNIDRLESFGEMLDDIDLKTADAEIGSNVRKMKVSGVEISVRPEIILRGVGPKGQELVGAMKLQMTAETHFNTEAAGYVSALVQEYCRRFLTRGDEIVHAPYCQVIDVGNETVHSGVKATTRRMRDIEAACQNISDLWPSV